jgi:hypothetical protein
MAERSSDNESRLVVSHNDTKPKDLKQPWQLPIIEYVNLAWSENDGGATFDGVGGSS